VPQAITQTRSRKRLPKWPLAVLLPALAVVGCSTDPDTGALHGEGQEALDRAVAIAQPPLEFEIIKPSYLPEGTSPENPLSYSLTRRDVTLAFIASDDETLPIEKRARVEIRESLDESGPGSVEMNPHLEESEIAGRPVIIHRQRESISGVFVAIYWQQDDLSIWATLDWFPPPGSPSLSLTPEMEEEAFRVAESIMSQ
jgi:hypothetical protein